MARGDRWPSKWWFWGALILPNMYLLVMLVLAAVVMYGRRPSPLVPSRLESLHDVLEVPGETFDEWLVQPLLEAWQLDPLKNMALCLALVIGLWELAAVVVALLFYGAACLVYAAVPGQPVDEKGRPDGSR